MNSYDETNLKLLKLMKESPDEVFDFICNNYMDFSRFDLVDIVKELVYAMRNDPELLKDAGEELQERWYYKFEE